jgi:glycosyltransferase involved in cell wall biosynthesis
MGKPCISFDLDGAPEVIIPNQTGFLVKPGDTVGLSTAISCLLSDPEMRARMGAAGRRLVDPAFRVETMVDRTAAVYTRLIQEFPERMRAFEPGA